MEYGQFKNDDQQRNGKDMVLKIQGTEVFWCFLEVSFNWFS